MEEIHRADPRTRRLALALLAIASVVGAGALFVLERLREPILSWLLANVDRAGLAVVLALLLLISAPALLLSAWIWRYGQRVLRCNRHPPDGARVVRDTPVARGAAARRYARLYQALAALFVLAIAATAWIFSQLWALR